MGELSKAVMCPSNVPISKELMAGPVIAADGNTHGHGRVSRSSRGWLESATHHPRHEPGHTMDHTTTMNLGLEEY